MGIAARLDDVGRPAWIAILVVSFFAFPPLTLVLLVYLFWSGRMSFNFNLGQGRWQDRVGQFEQRMRGGWCGNGGGRSRQSSGNWAFDDYREDTLKRLEEEQREFRDFLDRLRRAKDKAEFDQFMAERGRRRDEGETESAQA